jgi:phosphoheptose isomerase
VNGLDHLSELRRTLGDLEHDLERLDAWGATVASALEAGGRLLAAGNGGSAAQAQHLTAELVGRYLTDRRALSAIALHADTSALTAIVNDYGAERAFARTVEAHGRPGDVLVAFSTSGASPNVLAAVDAARSGGLTTFALTGRSPNPLARAAGEAITVDAGTPTVQEVHQVAIHLLCAAIDARIATPVGAGR